MEARSRSRHFDNGVHSWLGAGERVKNGRLHYDYHVVNLDSRKYLYPKNDYPVQATKTIISILVISFFLFSPDTYIHTSTTM